MKTKQDFVDLLKTDIKKFNKYRKETNYCRIDLNRSYLRCLKLVGSDLNHTDLSYADFSNSNLSYADLSHTDLSGADLNHTDLRSVDLTGSNFRSAEKQQKKGE